MAALVACCVKLASTDKAIHYEYGHAESRPQLGETPGAGETECVGGWLVSGVNGVGCGGCTPIFFKQKL